MKPNSCYHFETDIYLNYILNINSTSQRTERVTIIQKK